MEVFPGNFNVIKNHGFELIEGNVFHICDLVKDRKWDLIMWCHGPGHVYLNQLESILEDLKKVCNQGILLCCPWGQNIQGSMYGNSFEEHKSTLDEKIFVNHGYDVQVFFARGNPGNGEIYASYFNSSFTNIV